MGEKEIKVTLNHEDWNIISELAHISNVTNEQALLNLFNYYIKVPRQHINKIYEDVQTRIEFENFLESFRSSFNQLILSGSQSSHFDTAMIEVFQRFRDEHFLNMRILVDLYNVYLDAKNS